jgi:hypothetical protein
MPKVSQAGQQGTPEQSANAGAGAVKPLYKSREMSGRTRIISLVVGDAICFVVFATLGADQHGEGFNLLYNLWVAFPFLIAWFLIAPFVGAYRKEVAYKPSVMAGRTLLSWVCAWPVAMFVRWLLVDLAKGTPWSSFFSFAVVALAFNTGLLLLWRWPFALNNDLRRRGI